MIKRIQPMQQMYLKVRSGFRTSIFARSNVIIFMYCNISFCFKNSLFQSSVTFTVCKTSIIMRIFLIKNDKLVFQKVSKTHSLTYHLMLTKISLVLTASPVFQVQPAFFFNAYTNKPVSQFNSHVCGCLFYTKKSSNYSMVGLRASQ